MAFGIALVAFLTAWAITFLLARLLRGRVVDIPNERSSHSAPTPRGGGLGILAGLAAGAALSWWMGGPTPPLPLVAGTALIAVSGWIDDLFHLPAAWRLGVQTAAAAIVLSATGALQRLPLPSPFDVPLGAAGAPVSVLWIVGVVNIYNFLDGIDGFAGLQGLLAGAALAFIGLDPGSSMLGLALAASAVGFLLQNWHPARIFMGDVGSTTIGFLIATLPLHVAGSRQHMAVFCAALTIWFFLADGAYTLVRRLIRRQRIWQAHREHLYQQLVRAGLPHDAVVARVGAMAAGVGVAAVIATRADRTPLYWAALLLAVLGFLAYFFWVRRRLGARAARGAGRG